MSPTGLRPWLNNKQVIAISFLAVSLLLAAGTTRAEDFSGKPIKLLVGASPGGTTDTMARAIATPLSTTLGRPVIVENRPGAGGIPMPVPASLPGGGHQALDLGLGQIFAGAVTAPTPNWGKNSGWRDAADR
jgi:hypothetical protein